MTSALPLFGNRLCEKVGSGAALISNSQYDKNASEFEFKISPSASQGAVTVIGLANDGLAREDHFLDIVFDAQKFANADFGIVFGGGSQYFSGGYTSRSYALNVSTTDNSTSNSSTYKIRVDGSTFEVLTAGLDNQY